MKLPIVIAVAAMIGFYSCNPGQQNEKTVFVNDTTHIQDTILFIKDSMAAQKFADSLPNGFYQGMFPCVGCEGIQETFLFTPDKKFKAQEFTWGSSGKPKASEGTWERKDRYIVLNQNGKTIGIYKYYSDTLRGIEVMGSKITDSVAGHYRLAKKTTASDNPAWKKKKEEGVDFAGVGTDPFWNLEIDNEKFILFKVSDWRKPVITPNEKPMVTKDSTVYSLVAENAPLRIVIYPQFGSDGMSDFLYEYKVMVNYKGKTYNGNGLYLSKDASAASVK